MTKNNMAGKFIIDNLDRKIIYELDTDSRQSASHIGKKLRIHKNVANFRIKRLVDQEIIRQFIAIISPNSFGLTPYKFYFQMQNLTKDNEERFLKFIKKLPLYWSAKVSGRWDYILGVMIHDIDELSKIKNEILNNFGEEIINKTLSVLVEASYYPRKYLADKKTSGGAKYWMGSAKKEDLDSFDIRLLSALANNARMSIVDISEELGLTEKTIIQRIKSLEKRKIILDYMVSLNLEKFGYRFFKCFICLKNHHSEDIKDFRDYCLNHENITHLVECVGDWDLEPEFEVENFERFQEILGEIRDKFKNLIKSIETINIIQENSYTCLPKPF